MKKNDEYYLAPDGKFANDVFYLHPLDEALIQRDVTVQDREGPIDLWEASKVQFDYLQQCKRDEPQLRYDVYQKIGTRFVRFHPEDDQPKEKVGRKQSGGLVTLIRHIEASNKNRPMIH